MVTFRFTVREKEFRASSNTDNPYEIVKDVRRQILDILSQEQVIEPKHLHATIIESFSRQYPIKGEAEPIELGELAKAARARPRNGSSPAIQRSRRS